jgi:hypothetical protein
MGWREEEEWMGGERGRGNQLGFLLASRFFLCSCPCRWAISFIRLVGYRFCDDID